ncbi:sensor histidine kinase [Planctomonas sp. JC2975]|uniref:sensor histidine kinase n=1 Tax=Planctomonas sp. JC2975 TaxID=2729626 RepID=UPI0014749048|nr:sensor histidine kinase [Planctomonas sp. JC2975]NNC13254.1 sensor histidine kinase [Planctomonas sp. JC2975]
MEPISGASTSLRSRSRLPGTSVAVVVIAAATVLAAILILTYAGDALNPPWQVAAAFAIGALETGFALVVARGAPGDVTAPLLAALGLIVVTTNSVDTPADGVFAGDWMLLYLPLALILLLLPTGRPATRFWRWVTWTLCSAVGAFILVCAAQAIWPQASEALIVPTLVLLFGFFGCLIACAVAPFARYRHASELEQIRLRWLLVAGLSVPLTLLLCWASYLAIGVPDLVVFGLLVMFVAVPAGATISLTRPQLFDVDRATSAIATALTLAAIALVGLTLASIAVGETMDEWPSISAAVVTAGATFGAVLAFPFARHGFDRMLYPERARTVARLHRMTSRVDAGLAEPEVVQEVLREALRDPRLVVAYRRLADHELVGLDGTPVGAAGVLATVRSRGEEIGAIIPSPAHVKRPAAAIARAAAPLVDSVRVRSELALAAAEVEASRERLLRAGYEERRRLERDLHDGAQQRLVALGMRLRVLQRAADADGPVAAALDDAVAQLGTAVAELRQLAHGVRPSALDDGLAAALAELERSSPQTLELDIRAGDLPDAVATTAYYVVNEAVANALRHAEAERVLVRVREADGTLLVRVSDDGRGGAAPRSTGGLTGLSDRVAALGGRLSVASTSGRGTVVEARIPCAS